jgi:hypothetical protein
MQKSLSILLQTLNPGVSTFGRPYDSTQGISLEVQVVLFVMILLFGVYVGIRVWWSLRKDKKNKK